MCIKGVCQRKRGDWSWLKQCCGLQDWQEGGRCCPCCLADDQACPWTDFSLHAKWRKTCVDHKLFLMMAQQGGGYLSLLFRLPGFRYEHIQPDLMHTSCGGVLLGVLGNVLFELFREMGGLITKPAVILADLEMLLKYASKRLKQAKCPVKHLTMGMIRQQGRPYLKYKCANARALLYCVLYVLETLILPKTPSQELRLHLVKNYVDMYNHLYAWKDGDNRGKQAAASGQKMLMLYSELTILNRADGQCINLWRPYPKCHILCHLLTDTVRNAGNPKDFWCYTDESRIGELAICGEKCNAQHVCRSLMLSMRIEEI